MSNRLPYTLEEIMAIKDPIEQMQARATLLSFMEGIKVEQERRQAPGTPANPHQSARVEGDTTTTFSPMRGTGGYRGGFRGGHRGGHHSDIPYRGSYATPRGRGAPYHPYAQRPFKNNSVTFTKSKVSSVTPEGTTPAALTTEAPNQDQDGDQIKQMLCPAFTRTGVCIRHNCSLLHDTEKLAACKRQLHKGDCAKGDVCSLSHHFTAHNAPTCEYFQESRCTNDPCNFAHIRINPSAENCIDFGTVGYCPKGSDCPERHAHECPHFANNGICDYGSNCRLGHVQRASRMKKAAQDTPGQVSPAIRGSPSFPSPEPRRSPLTSSPTSINSPNFTQQNDFLAFDDN